MYDKTALLAIDYLILVSKGRNESFLFVRPMTLTDANLNRRIANPVILRTYYISCIRVV